MRFREGERIFEGEVGRGKEVFGVWELLSVRIGSDYRDYGFGEIVGIFFFLLGWVNVFFFEVRLFKYLVVIFF